MINKRFIHSLLTVFTSLTIMSPLSAVGMDLPRVSDASSDVTGEVQTLNEIIAMTKESLKAQEIIRNKTKAYHQLQIAYLNDPEDRELLFRMVKSSYKLLELINNNHLRHVFTPEFLHELEVFAQVAVKRGIPRPR